MPKLLALAIAVVVGFEFGPALAIARASAPVASSYEQRVERDTLKLGERIEPRVFPAPALARLPSAPAARRLAGVDVVGLRMAAYARAPERRAEVPRFELPMKHVSASSAGTPQGLERLHLGRELNQSRSSQEDPGDVCHEQRK